MLTIEALKRMREMMNNYEKMNVSGKNVYVFEDHAMAVLPWREIHKDIGKQPYLITLDYTATTCQDTFQRFHLHI